LAFPGIDESEHLSVRSVQKVFKKACAKVELELRQELRERNLGKCVGKSVQWLRENKETTEKTVDDRLFSDAESKRDEWNRLKPFFDEIMSNDEENIIIVSHGDLLSVFNMMWIGLEVEMTEKFELFGLSGGVTFMFQLEDGKRVIRRMGDLSYTK